MFVQVIEGRVADQAGLRRSIDRWMADLRPGAVGFLGTTAGITDDGRCISLVRFESAASARVNSERAEQGQWWAETEKAFDGPVTFSDSDDVATFLAGGSDDAGFVQIMRGRGDRSRIAALDAQFSEHAPTFRPDVIGGMRVWLGPDRYLEATYFTSEEEARANETKEPPPELVASMHEFEDLTKDVEFLDLHDPWLF
jgi:hypothetical protein